MRCSRGERTPRMWSVHPEVRHGLVDLRLHRREHRHVRLAVRPVPRPHHRRDVDAMGALDRGHPLERHGEAASGALGSTARRQIGFAQPREVGTVSIGNVSAQIGPVRGPSHVVNPTSKRQELPGEAGRNVEYRGRSPPPPRRGRGSPTRISPRRRHGRSRPRRCAGAPCARAPSPRPRRRAPPRRTP